MIDPASAAGLERIAERERDVRGAYRPGFTPAPDAARPARAVPDANPLGVVAPEGGYFLTAAPGGVAYSRDGSFRLEGGALVTADGSPVLGFTGASRERVAALRVDPYDAALGRVSAPRVDADGTFGYTRATVDPRTGERRVERVAAGRVALARFPAGTQPERIDATRVRPPRGVDAVVGTPAGGGFGALATHARDLGGLDLVTGLEKMKEAYLSYEAMRAAHHVRGTLEKTAMDLLK